MTVAFVGFLIVTSIAAAVLAVRAL